MARDPPKQLFRRLDDLTAFPREVPRAEHLKRVGGEPGHAWTVRSGSRAGNRRDGLCLLTVLAVLGLLAVMTVRAAASPMTRDPRPPAAPAGSAAAPAPVAADPCASQAAASSANAAAVPRPRAAVPDAPPVASVVAAAYRAAGLDDDPAPGWRRRARLAALVPRVALRDGPVASWHDISDPTIGYVSLFAVTATWQLDRLVYDRDELRITSIATARRRERRRLGMRVVHAYYAWLRARGAARGDPRGELAADEAAAVLDALTDGWFGRALGDH